MFENFWVILTCIIMVGSVGVAVRELNQMRRSRHSELLMDLYQMWEDEPLMEARTLIKAIKLKEALKEKLEEWDKGEQKEFFIALRVCNFFEHIGHLVVKKYLKGKDAEDLMGPSIIKYYEIFEDYIKEHRKEDNHIYENFQRLKEETEKF